MDYCKFRNDASRKLAHLERQIALLEASKFAIEEGDSAHPGGGTQIDYPQPPSYQKPLDDRKSELDDRLSSLECERDAWRTVLPRYEKLCTLQPQIERSEMSALRQAVHLLKRAETTFDDASINPNIARITEYREHLDGIVREIKDAIIDLQMHRVTILEQRGQKNDALKLLEDVLNASTFNRDKDAGHSGSRENWAYQKYVVLLETRAASPKDLEKAVDIRKTLLDYDAAERNAKRLANLCQRVGDLRGAIAAYLEWYRCIDLKHGKNGSVGLVVDLEKCHTDLMLVCRLGEQIQGIGATMDERECYSTALSFFKRFEHADGIARVQRLLTERGVPNLPSEDLPTGEYSMDELSKYQRILDIINLQIADYGGEMRAPTNLINQRDNTVGKIQELRSSGSMIWKKGGDHP